MDLNLEGKTILVAASSSGIGKAIAMEFAREGANVMICSRNEKKLIKTVDEMKQEAQHSHIDYTVADLSNQEDISSLIEQTIKVFGHLDVLITNAGGPPSGKFDDFDDASWETAFNNNLLSVIRLIRSALPYLRKSSSGRILNIASTSIKQPIEGLILSNTFRAGIAGLAKSLATELAPDHILINTIAPGRIATDRTLQLDENRAVSLQTSIIDIRAQSERNIPLGRYGNPEELAKTVVFLGSNANSYITGQTILIDGGMVKAL